MDSWFDQLSMDSWFDQLSDAKDCQDLVKQWVERRHKLIDKSRKNFSLLRWQLPDQTVDLVDLPLGILG